MSVFGTREDDPLLQNDPLAPSSDNEQEGKSSPEETPSEESSETAPPDKETVPPDGPETEAATANSEGPDSVFGSGSSSETEEENHFRFGGSDETRVIVRSAEEAATGRLTVLNSAFDQGWCLDRVEVREDSPPDASSDEEGPLSEGPSATEDLSFLLAFVLRQPE